MAFPMKNTHHFQNHMGSPASPDLQRQAVLHSFNKKEERAHQMVAHTNSFASLPLYKTPPSTYKLRRPFNPFNRNLMERLECSTFSPNVFQHVISPGEISSEEFRWTIEDVSRIKPARIEETSVSNDDVDSVDNLTEQSAQEAIERYFSKVEIPSPWDAPIHSSSPLSATPQMVHKSKTTTISDSISPLTTNYRRRTSTSTCLTSHVSTQTCWSFPPVLPENVEAVLKPYLKPVNSECETDEEYLSTSSLRRKLNFTKAQHSSERFTSDDEEMSCDKFTLDDGFSSPLSHFRAVTPLPMLSPPDVSPIPSSTNTTQSKIKLSTRLNFTDSRCDKSNFIENQESISLMVTSMTDLNHCNNTANKKRDDRNKMESRDDISADNYNYRTGELDCNSHDTGYQTQNSNDKTGWAGTTGVSEIMEITNSANTSWAEPILQACSTPTKDEIFLV